MLCRAISRSVSHLSSLGWASLPGLGSPGLRGRSPLLPLPLHSFLRAHPQSFSLSFQPLSPPSPSSPGLCQTCWCWRFGCGKAVGAVGKLGHCSSPEEEESPCRCLTDASRAPEPAISIPTSLPAPDLRLFKPSLALSFLLPSYLWLCGG